MTDPKVTHQVPFHTTELLLGFWTLQWFQFHNKQCQTKFTGSLKPKQILPNSFLQTSNNQQINNPKKNKRKEKPKGKTSIIHQSLRMHKLNKSKAKNLLSELNKNHEITHIAFSLKFQIQRNIN